MLCCDIRQQKLCSAAIYNCFAICIIDNCAVFTNELLMIKSPFEILKLLSFPGESFKAHRLVLAACSAHFSKLFSNSTLNGQLIVILEGTHHQDLQILLQFMYKGVAYLHQDRIESVLRTAEVLQVAESQISSNLITKLQKNFPFFEKMLKSLMDIAKQFRGWFCSTLKKNNL